MPQWVKREVNSLMAGQSITVWWSIAEEDSCLNETKHIVWGEKICTNESPIIMTAPQCDFKWQLTDLVIIKATSGASVILSDMIRVYFSHPNPPTPLPAVQRMSSSFAQRVNNSHLTASSWTGDVFIPSVTLLSPSEQVGKKEALRGQLLLDVLGAQLECLPASSHSHTHTHTHPHPGSHNSHLAGFGVALSCQAQEILLHPVSALLVCCACGRARVFMCKTMTVTTGLAGTAAATALLHNPSQVAC